jgi:hypothetical protein
VKQAINAIIVTIHQLNGPHGRPAPATLTSR